MLSIPAYDMPIVDLKDRAKVLEQSGDFVSVLWQQPGSLAFVARGRTYRSEFHINPTDEVMYMIKGSMNLHYRTFEGEEKIAVIPEGSAIHTPAGIPHSPRFPADAYVLVIERARQKGEEDAFQWHCPECDHQLHEERFGVDDYGTDPVAQAYRNFFDNVEHRTCKACGHVMPNLLAEAQAAEAAARAEREATKAG